MIEAAKVQFSQQLDSKNQQFRLTNKKSCIFAVVLMADPVPPTYRNTKRYACSVSRNVGTSMSCRICVMVRALAWTVYNFSTQGFLQPLLKEVVYQCHASFYINTSLFGTEKVIKGCARLTYLGDTTMKRLIIVVLAIFSVGVSNSLLAQRYLEESGQEINLPARVENSFGKLKKGDRVTFSNMRIIHHNNDWDQLCLFVGDEKYDIKEVTKKCSFEYSSIQQFWDSRVIMDVMQDRQSYGYQAKMRSEIEEEAIRYIYYIKSNGEEFNDPYLESYLYTLVSKVAPSYLIDDRPVNINLLLLDDPTMNACCFPNGTIVVNTGLLAQLHSEDELVAILSHEIAHFVMDHTIININKAKEREESAKFWAGVATAIAAVGEAAIAANNRYYTPGGLTIGVALAASSFAKDVIDRFGMDYNKDQETAADAAAVEVLKLLGYDKNALSTALGRIRENYQAEHNNAMYYQSKTHPSLVSRIEKNGVANLKYTNSDFEKKVSFAVTNAATMKYLYRRFSQVIPLVDQNIKNNVATTEDYILKANCLLSLDNTNESNNEAMRLINKAKQIEPNNINIYKAEIIAMLRLDKKHETIRMLEDYVVKLDQLLEQNKNTSERVYNAAFSFAIPERDWARKMIVKLNGI